MAGGAGHEWLGKTAAPRDQFDMRALLLVLSVRVAGNGSCAAVGLDGCKGHDKMHGFIW